MNREFSEKSPFSLRQAAVKLLQAAVLALVVISAMRARAEEDRIVKVRVAPIYPEIARRMKIDGAVNIQATVDADGKVSDAKTVGGNRLLAPAAEDAVRKWSFASGSGTSKVNVEVNFVLNQ
jgi:TonB family protein